MVDFLKEHPHHITSITQGYLTGQIVVASPFMLDSRFHQTVIYICGHDQNGAMGFIINKPLPSVHFQDLLDQLHIEHDQKHYDFSVFYGGPVEIGRGFVLHSTDYDQQTTVKINEHFSITATLEILKVLADNKGPKKSLLMLGYSGWTAGQLEQEIQDNQWLVLPGDQRFVYSTDINEKWHYAYEQLGMNPHFFSIDSGHA